MVFTCIIVSNPGPLDVQGSRDTMAGTHHLTLLDGEMVIDKIKDGEYKRRYLIYDLMMLNQVSLAKVNLTKCLDLTI